MRRCLWLMVVAATTAVAMATGCGDGGDGDQSRKVQFTQMVVFGDSLSDTGSYATPVLVGASGGGGRFTINNPTGTAAAKIWVDHIAAALGVPVPCPAQTGLQSSGPLVAFAAALTDSPNAACTGYAQGGARVTDPIGPANQGRPMDDTQRFLGQLTDPLFNQMTRHLVRVGGTYAGTELVAILAGGNDLIINLDRLERAEITDVEAVAAMHAAGDQLAVYIKDLIIDKGAKHVLVINLPDVSLTPSTLVRNNAGVSLLVRTMASRFNTRLATGLAGAGEVVVVDAFTVSQTQAAQPAQFGLTNVTTPACDLAALATALFSSSLVCTTNTLVGGDTSHFLYADGVHPTPYGHQLLAQLIAQRLIESGRL